MANEEVLGPRKTMFVLVIVVGCFAVLWPRILSPLVMGSSRDQLKPNQFDREAGCCEVLFDKEMVVLQLIEEVCSSAVHSNGKLTPYTAAECRKAVNDTCGLDLAAFLKRNENVGKSSKMLVETLKNSNSSCLRENFGVEVWNLGVHQPQNSWLFEDTIKQERPSLRGMGPHPALRERGRAIPPGAPAPARTITMPPHARVRSSPLSVYYELDIKPPPIPGMRPPLGSPGGPVPAPKSSMGFVMPIYTICIIVFFVYTLSKILFKRTGSSPYETVSPDPQFRRRVFRDDSRTSPDKLVVTAISGLVAEVQQQMEASYAQNQQRQDVQDNHTRPYTNGTVLHNSGPVHIVASEYREQPKEKSPAPQKEKELSPTPEETKESSPEPEVVETEVSKPVEQKEFTPEQKESSPKEPKESSPIPIQDEKEPSPENESTLDLEKDPISEPTTDKKQTSEEKLEQQSSEEPELTEKADELIKITDDVKVHKNGDLRKTEEFLQEEVKSSKETKEKQSTPELLEEAIKDVGDDENATVKVVGMETTAHSADGGAWTPRAGELPRVTEATPPRHEAAEVQSIYLETEIPQQSRVLVADFAENTSGRPAPTKHSPMVVSGKMTLSLIQDAPRDTPERDLESTVDDFTTASAVTQNAAEKDEAIGSDEEIEEEIEIEEIEEEVEDEEEVEQEDQEVNDHDRSNQKVGGQAIEEIENTEEDLKADDQEVINQEVQDHAEGGQAIEDQEIDNEEVSDQEVDDNEVSDQEVYDDQAVHDHTVGHKELEGGLVDNQEVSDQEVDDEEELEQEVEDEEVEVEK